MRNSKTILMATLMSGVAFASPAFAQVANTPAPANPQAQPELAVTPKDETPATQENPADLPGQDRQDTQKGSPETIVVTGSRIASPNITSLAPVQVVGEQDIDRSGTVNIQDVLLQNPAFGTPGVSRTNSAFTTTGGGAATVDLRDLGSARTLVLINSRRVVGGFGGSSTVDLNNIPTQFIERIDVLTGGASSLYGSDAVAGVVNIIYKRNFEGLLAEGQYGITQRGDAPEYQASLTWGANVADGRGNIMLHLGYTDQGELLSRDRKDTRIDNRGVFWYVTGDPADYRTAQEPFFSSFPLQGRFTVGPGAGRVYTYGPTGALQPCQSVNGPSCTVGGVTYPGATGFNRQFFRTLSTPVKRYLFAAQGSYDITDNISAFVEGTFAKVNSERDIEPFAYDSGGANPGWPTGRMPLESRVTLANGTSVIVRNPYVPDAIFNFATDRDGDGLRDAAVARRLGELGTRFSTADREFFRFVTGLKGTVFGDRFNWDVSYNIGRTTENQFSNGQFNLPLLQAAQQAVRENAQTGDLNGNGFVGDIVCADPLRRATGCVPINMFGLGSISQAAATYVAAELDHSFNVQQQVWSANLSGPIFTLPAGDVGLAVGAEYRKERSSENWDALTNQGLTGGNAAPDTRGKFNVKEAYGELNVPLLKDMPFVKQLNFRTAGRISDYSTVGSVKTWNVGADYAPIDDVRFRGTYATAIRAPNIGELFTGPSQTFPTGLNDPCKGIQAAGGGALGDRCRAAPGVLTNIADNGGTFTVSQPDQQGISGFNTGNPNLKAEKSKSLTAGVVITPKSINFLRNFVLSVDYYDIKVDKAINQPSRATILNQCYVVGNPAFCGFIVRRPTVSGSNNAGSLAFVNRASVNSGGLQVKGIDTVVQYRSGLGQFFGNPLRLDAKVAWTHGITGWVIDLPDAPKDHFVSEIGTARDRVNATVSFDNGKTGLTLNGYYIGKSYEDDQSIGPGTAYDLGIHDIVVPAQFYLNGQIRFTPVRSYEFFVGVDNIFDHKYPLIYQGSPSNITGQNTASDVYDVYGRRFYAGARLRF